MSMAWSRPTFETRTQALTSETCATAAHGYFDINLDVVWDTLQQSSPEPEIAIAAIAKARR